MSWVRPWRASYRLARVAAHLAAGVATVGVVYPLVSAATRRRLKQRWSRLLLTHLGVELHGIGSAATGALVVANHVSWLDIFAINAVRPAAFVCKDDVRRWPVIGWLCAHTETLFIVRGSRRDARQIGGEMAAVLAGGHCVAVFPEGTTTDGTHLLPFRSALFQPAVNVGAGVQPVLIRYRQACGAVSSAPVYIGETTLLQSMWRIASTSRTIAVLEFTATVDTRGMDRRDLAGGAETRLWERMQRPPVVAGRTLRPAADEPVHAAAG